MNTIYFLNLDLFGLNPAGALVTLEGDEARKLFDALRSTSVLPLSEEKQNALDSLKAFFATAFLYYGGHASDHACTTRGAVQTAEKALSVLGA